MGAPIKLKTLYVSVTDPGSHRGVRSGVVLIGRV
jgi:hypothetical protein